MREACGLRGLAEGLRLAAELGGTLLSGEGGGLVLVERIPAHDAPRVAVLGRGPKDLAEALEAQATSAPPLGLVALLPLPGTDLAAVLGRERRRIGALVAALDAGLPWLGKGPMLVRCLPGRLRGTGPLAPLTMASIQRFEWQRYGADEGLLQPQWREGEAPWWPGTPRPEASEILTEPLELPTATPLTEALRQALRTATGRPVDFLPHPGDPEPLRALLQLTPHFAAFRGPREAWGQTLALLARLPAPPHFCARC